VVLEREICQGLPKGCQRSGAMAPGKKKVVVTPELLEDYSGVRKFSYGKAEDKDQIGQVTGLAWTQVGGELLTIEAVAVPGKGRHTKTGSLGDVMQESITAALTVVRARSRTCWVFLSIFMKIMTSTFIFLKGQLRRMAPVQGLGCARPLCLF
jgi:ATP-dependent Lon protease